MSNRLRNAVGAGLISLVATVPATAQAAVYDFKMTGGGQALLSAFSKNMLVEVTADPANPSNVLFELTNGLYSEPMSLIAFTYFDTGTGSYGNLFSGMSILGFTGQVNYVQRTATTHPFLPANFTPEYKFGLSTVFPFDQEKWGVNPGDSVTLSAMLGSGRSFSDVLAALDLGISTNPVTAASGLRLGIFTYHLLGPALYDDAAHITNSIVFAPVPEPSTWLMMLSALGAIGGVVRRRSRVA